MLWGLCTIVCDRVPTESCTLSLHDALPIWAARRSRTSARIGRARGPAEKFSSRAQPAGCSPLRLRARGEFLGGGSEEHTSELQSLTNLVCRLLLEKKKSQNTTYRPLCRNLY